MSAAPLELPRWVDLVVLPAVNLALALLVAGLVVLVAGLDPLQVVTLLVKGAFGSKAGLSYTLYYATTFVFTGLAVAVAFHAGLFNIGGEGQAMMGGLGAGLAALAFAERLPAWAMLPLMVLAAMAFGLAWAAVPAALQAWRGSHVVITTIMFNFIASAVLVYLLVDVIKEPGNMSPETRSFAPSAHLPGVHATLAALGIDWPRTPLNLGIVLAVLAALLFGALYQGGAELAFEVSGFSRDMVFTLQGLVVLFAGALGQVAAPTLARLFARRPRAAAAA